MLVEHALLEGPMLVEPAPLSAAYTCYIPLAFREYRVDLRTCLGNGPNLESTHVIFSVYISETSPKLHRHIE